MPFVPNQASRIRVLTELRSGLGFVHDDSPEVTGVGIMGGAFFPSRGRLLINTAAWILGEVVLGACCLAIGLNGHR